MNLFIQLQGREAPGNNRGLRCCCFICHSALPIISAFTMFSSLYLNRTDDLCSQCAEGGGRGGGESGLLVAEICCQKVQVHKYGTKKVGGGGY